MINIEGKSDKQLLRMSINHWKRLKNTNIFAIRKDKESPTANNCALCAKYQTSCSSVRTDCIGCPVYKKTKKRRCNKTPYAAAATMYFKIQEFDLRNESAYAKIKLRIKEKLIPLIQKEIDFLESLVT